MKPNPSIEELKQMTPGKEKEVVQLERLIKLAKQSPFAAANQDFLDLQDLRLQEKKSMVEIAKTIIEAIEKDAPQKRS